MNMFETMSHCIIGSGRPSWLKPDWKAGLSITGNDLSAIPPTWLSLSLLSPAYGMAVENGTAAASSSPDRPRSVPRLNLGGPLFAYLHADLRVCPQI